MTPLGWAVVAAIVIIWFVIADRRKKTRDAEREAELQRRGQAVLEERKAFLARFPNRDPSTRTRIVKLVRDLQPGDMIRCAMESPMTVAFERPDTKYLEVPGRGLMPMVPGGNSMFPGEYDGTWRTMEYRVFVGFEEAFNDKLIFVKYVDLDGKGLWSFGTEKDDEIAVYVERAP